MLSLYHGDKKVGEARIKTQPGKFMIAGEGLCVGRDGGAGVTDDYPGAGGGRDDDEGVARAR
jgi:arylsulfatase